MQKKILIFQNLLVFRAFFEKSVFWENGRGKPNQQNFEKFKTIFRISGGNFIGLFNGILFVFILSVVVDTQKETFLP